MNKTEFIQGSVSVTTTAGRLSSTKGTLVREVIMERTGTEAGLVRMGTSAVTTALGINILGTAGGSGDQFNQYTLSAENAAERGLRGIGSGQARIDLYDIYLITNTSTVAVSWLAIT